MPLSSRDIIAIIVLALISLLLYTDKINTSIFVAVVSIILGYYFGQYIRPQTPEKAKNNV